MAIRFGYYADCFNHTGAGVQMNPPEIEAMNLLNSILNRENNDLNVVAAWGLIIDALLRLQILKEQNNRFLDLLAKGNRIEEENEKLLTQLSELKREK